MKPLTHAFFGALDLEKGLKDEVQNGVEEELIVLWDEALNGIETTLWYEKGAAISAELLDVFAVFLTSFEEYKGKALTALEEYLKEDDGYQAFHRESLELDVPKEISAFVESMTITDIGLWAGGENRIIIDFMIDPVESDEILSVEFDENLKVKGVVWES